MKCIQIFKDGKMDELNLALIHLQSSIDNGGNNSVILEHLGDVYLKMGNIEKAQGIFNKSVILNPANEKLKAKFLNEKYYLFNLENNGNLINIFFDKDSYDLIGWQTEDIYQNLVVTYIFNVKKNSNVDEKIFKLPQAH